MSGANQTRVATRNISYTVQLAPYLVEAVCELTRAVRDRTHSQTEISGLLFGSAETGFTVVEALKNFKDSGPRSELVRRERLDKAFITAMTEAAQDPELAALKLVGWFSLRGGSGLLNSDIDFHNRHFKSSEDLALVIWRETDAQAIAEVYSKGEDSRLTTDDYRWSTVRLSTEMRRVSEPIDLAMRVKVGEDSYLRTYESTDAEKREEWKKLAIAAKESLLGFLPGRRKAATPPEQTAAAENWDAAALFRQANEPAKSRRAGSNPQANPEVSGLPMVINHPVKPRSISPWIATAAVFILFSGITFAVLAMTGATSGNGKLAQVLRILFPGTDLAVRVDSQGEKLLLSWNRHNPAVASASDALLQIFDGAEHREIRLDAGQVADGSVLYKPVTNDVTFRLEVHGTNQSTVMGSLRIVDATSTTVSARGDRSLDVSKGPALAGQARIPETGDRPVAGARRPPSYRSSENGKIAVPTPLPAATQTAAPPKNEEVPIETLAPAASNSAQNTTPAPVPQFHASPQTPGSTINGWDSAAPDHDDPAADARSAFVAPKPLFQVLPDTKAGTVTQVTRVEVQVNIDTAGRVIAARVLNEGNISSALSNSAVTAARQWTFQPATMRGEKIASNHTILFEFRPESPDQP